MLDAGDKTVIDGHRVTRVSNEKGHAQYWCSDCEVQGDHAVFSTGIYGCPARPESLNVLTVCGGGINCRGHMDQDTPEWRAWKASESMPSDQVPHWTCDAEQVGARVAEQFRYFADRIGMRVRDWKLTGDGDGMAATFTHEAGRYELWASKTGKVTPLRVGDA